MSVLGILGTMHSEEIRKEANYTLKDLKELILEFKPDIICGEVRPEDFEKYLKDKNYDGYLGPNEYKRCIIPLCEKHNIKFIPVDWFEEDIARLNYLEDKSEEEIEDINRIFESITKEYIEIGKRSKIAFNSFEFNEFIQGKQNFQQELNPKVHNIYWTARNQIMIERIKNALKENESKKVLCTVGCEHNYFYYKELKSLNDWQIIYPLK